MPHAPIAHIGGPAAPLELGARHHLPIPPTPLVGRTDDMARLRALAGRADVRLVTLTGPGGVGKTRLVLEVAAALAPDFADGVYFVPLAAVDAAALVPSAVAPILDVKERGDTGLAEALQAYLRPKQVLLVLDNFEQVIPAGPLVARWLAAAPQLKVLVTSREVLHIRGEHEFPVLPLALPPSDHPPDVAGLAANPAVTLFVQRARALQPDFVLSERNAPVVAEICARLDGLPLALELAAARIKLLSLPALLARLTDRLRLLTGGAHDLPLRQQTLRNTLDWSYDLLSPDEQRLFRALAVFAGGWLLVAAEAVTADPPGAAAAGDAERGAAVLEGLGSLIDKSLLRHEATAGGEIRFGMLETVRAYAAEQLAGQEEAAAIHRRHAAYYNALTAAAAPALSGPEQGTWLQRLEDEHDNIRAALSWSLHEDGGLTALQMARVLWRFWDLHGYLTEGRQWMEQALRAGRDQPAALRADVLHGLSRLTWLQGDHTTTRHLVEESLTLWRQLGDAEGIARELHILGIIMGALQQPEQAQTYYEESLALWRQIGHQGNIARLLNSLGIAARARGDYDQARRIATESLEQHRALGNQRGIATALANLGFIAHGMGDETGALALFSESLQLRRDLGHRAGLIDCLVGFAGAYGGLGQTRQATRLASAVAALCESLGYALDPEDQQVFDHDLQGVRSRLDDAAFTQAWQAGQALTLDEAVEEALTPPAAPPAGAAAPPAAAPGLNEAAFGVAVQQALQHYTQARLLHGNPLLESRAVLRRAGSQATGPRRVAALQTWLQEACDLLQQGPRDVKFYRVLQHTYLRPAGTQEQIAALLNLPFSTYRRHLKEAVHRITAILWQAEMSE